MPDFAKYVDAICAAYDNTDYTPVFDNGKLIKTFCNYAVNEVARAMGCDDFIEPNTSETPLPMDADDICDFLNNNSDSDSQSPKPWLEIKIDPTQPDNTKIQMGTIQTWATKGYLTVACAKASELKQDHGHICVVRPGLLKMSGKWGAVPSVMNVGGENFISLGRSGVMKGRPVGVNEAFQILPRFFVWKNG